MNRFLFVAVPAEPSLSVLNTTHTSISVSGNRGACSPHLGDNQGLTLSLQLMYGVDDVCDTEGHVYKDLEGEQVNGIRNEINDYGDSMTPFINLF